MKKDKTEELSMKKLGKDISDLAQRFRKIEKIAKQQGLFLNHRELLECPCGKVLKVKL